MTNFISLQNFQSSVSDGGYSGTFVLSDSSAFLALSLLAGGDATMKWFNNDGSDIDATEKDYIDAVVSKALDELMRGGVVTSNIIGSVIPMASAYEYVPSNLLPCDGGTYNAAEYPDLYAVLDAAFILSETQFVTPDLNVGRVIVGSDELEIGDVGGSATHTLTIAEMPSHNHNKNETGTAEWVILNSGPAPPSRESFTGTGLPAFNLTVTGSRGGGEAHNNMPPYQKLTYYIVAL